MVAVLPILITHNWPNNLFLDNSTHANHFACRIVIIIRCAATCVTYWSCNATSFSSLILYFLLSLCTDRSVPSLLQRLWHSALVSSSLPASPNQDGSCPGRAHRQVPLVRCPLPPPLLSAPAGAGARPLAGGLAGDGRCWGSFPGSDHLHSRGECDADSQPQSSAHQAPDVGLLAAVDAFSQTPRQTDYEGDGLLRHSKWGRAQRRGRKHSHADSTCRLQAGIHADEDRVCLRQPGPGPPGWDQTRCAGF